MKKSNINNKLLIQEIVEQNRHLFIYSNYFFEEITREFEKRYPIKINSNMPIVINMKEFEILESKEKSCNYTQQQLFIANEFLSLSIAYNITNKLCEYNNIQKLEMFKELINDCKKLIQNTENYQLNDLNDLSNVLKYSMNFYKQAFMIIKEDNIKIDINTIPMPFIMIDYFIENVKKVLRNSSYFALVFLNDEKISTITNRSINSFITSRCNKDISVKVITKSNEWNTYYDLNNIHAEYIHDYDIIKIDEKEKTLKLTK